MAARLTVRVYWASVGTESVFGGVTEVAAVPGTPWIKLRYPGGENVWVSAENARSVTTKNASAGGDGTGRDEAPT